MFFRSGIKQKSIRLFYTYHAYWHTKRLCLPHCTNINENIYVRYCIYAYKHFQIQYQIKEKTKKKKGNFQKLTANKKYIFNVCADESRQNRSIRCRRKQFVTVHDESRSTRPSPAYYVLQLLRVQSHVSDFYKHGRTRERAIWWDGRNFTTSEHRCFSSLPKHDWTRIILKKITLPFSTVSVTSVWNGRTEFKRNFNELSVCNDDDLSTRRWIYFGWTKS